MVIRTLQVLTKICICFIVVSVPYHPVPNLLFNENSVQCKYLRRGPCAHMRRAECGRIHASLLGAIHTSKSQNRNGKKSF